MLSHGDRDPSQPGATRVKCKAAATLWFAVCSALPLSAQEIHFPAPVDFQTHFEPLDGVAATSGSRDGWESFPLSQETGYDPSITPETADGHSVLARELAPTQDGFFQLGFLRRVRLLSGDHASIRFRLRAPFLKHTAAVHLHIFRHAADEQHDFTLNGGDWQQLSTTLKTSGKTITAIAIAVDFPNASRLRAERLLLTDLHLEALAAKHLAVRQPEARWDGTRELFYLQRSLRPGEELLLRSDDAAQWTVMTPSGKRVAHGSGVEVRFRVPQDAQAGVWTVQLENPHSASTALLLVRPLRTLGLIFDAAPAISPQLIAVIRERKAQLEKTTVADAGRNIAFMSTEWLLPGLPSYFAEILQPSELALMDAMLFRATGDRAALQQSRMLLATMASWTTWVHPWFAAHGYLSYYPVGLMTKYIVMTAQFLGDDLPATERSKLDHSLLELAVKPTYEEYVEEDRLQFNYSNWIGNTVGGALLAALASDNPDAAGYALGLFVKERDHVAAAYTRDGSYGEGITYHRFDLETTELAAAASKRLLGVSLDEYLLNGERYMRYAAYSPTELLDYGDSHVDLNPANVFAYVAGLNRSAATTAFYFEHRAEGTTQILPRVLWEPGIKQVPVPDPEPASMCFPERGVAVLRDSWRTDSVVLAIRAGNNFNHNHADQGSIFYAADGTLWLGEAGYADYYKDLNFNSYNTQAIGHNTLLVDGNPESQVLPGNDVLGNAPRFAQTHFGEKADVVQADLTAVYPTLTRYTRTLIRLHRGPTVVLDEVHTAARHVFTVVWHPQQHASMFPEENRLLLSHDDNQLAVESFSDAEITSALRRSPFPLSAYEKSEREPIEAPMQLEVSTKMPAPGALLVTVIGDGRTETHWKKDDKGNTLTTSGWTLHIRRSPRLSVTAYSAEGKVLELLQ